VASVCIDFESELIECIDFESELIEFEEEDDHARLRVNYPPKVAV